MKSSKNNYTSVRKDVIHINHHKENENGTITVVIYLLLIKTEKGTTNVLTLSPSQEGPASKSHKHSPLEVDLPRQTTLSLSQGNKAS